MLGCVAALCLFLAGMCVRCVRARVPPVFPRREAEGDGAPTTVGSRHQPSRLRQILRWRWHSWPGRATYRQPRAAPAASLVGSGRRRGAEGEEGTRAWERQGR